MESAFDYLDSIEKDETNWVYFNRFLISYLRSKGRASGAYHGLIVSARIMALKSGLKLEEEKVFQVFIAEEVDRLVHRDKKAWAVYLKLISKSQPFYGEAVALSPYNEEIFPSLNKEGGELKLSGLEKEQGKARA